MINRPTILDSAGSSSVPETPVLFLRQRASCRDGFPRGESSFRVDCTVNCVSDESAINLRVRHRFPWAAPPRFPCFSMYGRDVFRGDAFVFSQSCSFPRGEEARRPRVPFRFLFRVRQMSRKLSRIFFLIVWKTIDKFSGIEHDSYQCDFIKIVKRNLLSSVLFESTMIADWFLLNLLNFIKETKVYLTYRWWEYTRTMLRVFDMANANILDGKDDQNSSHRGNFFASEFDCYNYNTANIQLSQSHRRPYRTFSSRKTNIPSTDKTRTQRSTRNHQVSPCESTRDVGLAYRDISLSFA